jgi:putative PIN family toxin of toxin-antitoxin system
MHKIILDTNILVSSLMKKSFPHFVVFDFVLAGRVSLCVSEPVLKEYNGVLTRPKFEKRNDNFSSMAKTLLDFITTNSIYFEPNITLSIIKDEKDNRLLELADISKADYLITGNTKHFTMSEYKSTKIISPRDYWELVSV